MAETWHAYESLRRRRNRRWHWWWWWLEELPLRARLSVLEPVEDIGLHDASELLEARRDLHDHVTCRRRGTRVEERLKHLDLLGRRAPPRPRRAHPTH